MKINSNIPIQTCFVRNEFLYNQESGHGELTQCWIIGCRAIQGQALTFYVLLENGVMFTGLPIHAFKHKKDAPGLSLTDSQMWDCLSYNIDVFELTFLRNMPCSVKLRNGSIENGLYLFSIDSHNQNDLRTLAELPREWKVMHFIKLDNGNYCLYPQDHILFTNKGLLTNPKKIDYKSNTINWIAENG